MRLSRADRSLLSEWWFTVDKMMLSAILLLMLCGLMLSLAASPAMAVKLGYEPYHFVKRHTLWFFPGLILLFTISLMSPPQMRRLALALLLSGVTLMIAVLIGGQEINGARRWVQFGGFSLQPSEIVKPAFVLLAAWLFAEALKRPDMPANIMALGLYAVFAVLLILQPDFGQTLLITFVWGGIFFLTGAALRWIGALALLSIAGSALAYVFLPHVTRRVDRFINPGSGDTFQIDRARQSFTEGGWFGRGPGEGQLKQILPDSHTDFIFAVVAEEFGIIACLILLALFGFIVLRGLYRAINTKDAFLRFASAGLILLFGFQAAINMAVNVGLIPAKGMTLPFISYGGSSLLGTAIAMGAVLSFTRKRPQDGPDYE